MSNTRCQARTCTLIRLSAAADRRRHAEALRERSTRLRLDLPHPLAAVLAATCVVWSVSAYAEPPRGASSGRKEGASAAAPSKAVLPKAGSGAPPSLSTAAGGSSPKPEPETPEADAKVRAHAIFEQGVAAYRERRYFDAVEMFLETNRIYPDYKLFFNIARAYEGLGNVAAALRYYREYARRSPVPSDRDEVAPNVQKLELSLSQKGVQQMSVFSNPDSATLVLDGHAVGITPWTGQTWPGRHRLTLSHAGYLDAQQIVEVSAHRSLDVELELRPEPPLLPAAPRTPEKPPPEPSRHVELITILTLTAGAILLGSAVVSELANSDTGVTRTTAFLAGAGLGTAAAGGVRLVFDLSRPSSGARQ